jgi:putative phage-type endonuclease
MNAMLKPIVNGPEIVQLTQGSPEWLEYRRMRRNASESAAVLGLSPWTTPYQLWLQKTGRSVQAVSHAMQRGTELEPAARRAYEDKTGLVMQPLVIEDVGYSASLDGMTLKGDLILEIKCPMRGSRSDLWQDVLADQVPAHYAVQVQHQLMVSGAIQAHLWVFDGAAGILQRIERDEDLMERIRLGWEAFQPYLDGDTPPPLSDADTVLREDAAWAQAAAAYSAAKQAADAGAQTLELSRQGLIALAQHAREQGAGVAVTRFWKAGTVDYKKVPALKGVDLDAYRGKSREEVRISVAI